MEPRTNDQTVSLSRRTVTKGIAWSAPALLAAASAPAFAASSRVDCTKVPPGLTRKTTSISPSVGGVTLISGGSRWSLPLGSWMLPDIKTLDGQDVTGMYIKPGYCDSGDCSYEMPSPEFNVWTQDEVQRTAKIVVSAPVGCSPIIAKEGLDIIWTIDTDIPYSADVCDVFTYHPSSILRRISIPVTVIPLVTLTTGSYLPVGTCCTYFNMEFALVHPDHASCYSTRAAESWSWTSGPLYT